MTALITDTIIKLPTNKVLAVAFNADASLCAAGDRDGIIHILDTHSGSVVQKLKQHLEFVYTLAFHPNGHLFSAGKDKSIREWDLSTGKMVRDYAGIFSIQAMQSASYCGLKATTRSHKMTILSLALGPDEKMATSSQDSTVKLWKNGDPVRTYDWHSAPVTCVRFQPETGVLYSASRDKTIRSWSEINGAVLHRYNGHMGEIVGMEFVDRDHFVSVDALGYMIAYQVDLESPAAFLYQASRSVFCASLIKDEALMLIGREDGVIEGVNVRPDNWENKSPVVCSTAGMEAHVKEVRGIAAFDADHIVSCDNEGKVIFWHLDKSA